MKYGFIFSSKDKTGWVGGGGGAAVLRLYGGKGVPAQGADLKGKY
jgi:hypothetical protein